MKTESDYMQELFRIKKFCMIHCFVWQGNLVKWIGRVKVHLLFFNPTLKEFCFFPFPFCRQVLCVCVCVVGGRDEKVGVGELFCVIQNQ